MRSFSSSSRPVRRLMCSTSVLFLRWAGGEGGAAGLERWWLRAAQRTGGVAGGIGQGGRWSPSSPKRPRRHLVEMEVTRRWSPVPTLRSKHTEVCRAAAGEKAEEEKLRVCPAMAV